MKVWKEFGSSHSANVSIIGEFENRGRAEEAYRLIEDFTRGFWEGRYPDVDSFKEAWAAREPDVRHVDVTQMDYEIGLDENPEVEIRDNNVLVSHLRTDNVAGIVKIFFYKGMAKTTITDHSV
jgi:hypothetical protein